MGAHFFSFNGVYEVEAEAKYFNAEAADLLRLWPASFRMCKEFTQTGSEQALEALAGER